MTRRKRQRERGSAMMITMVLITVMLAGGAAIVGMQTKSNRSADTTRTGLSALYCAEAGLSAARPVIVTNYDKWSASLGGTTQPDWLSSTAFSHDLDGDGVDDFAITLRDNDDEAAPAANNPTVDTDQKIFIVSTCIKYADQPKQVTELVEYKEAANCYASQEGGCNGRGNSNVATP
ncbi:MAG TPA: pilus assembly PilX N-terminal domain-containing protein [Kofleriaceae bacterium]|nr:pilus assembly PilX N-terminal domain-containing protein [Kofleriaceae bacterium]